MAPSCRARWRLREWFAVIAMSLIATLWSPRGMAYVLSAISPSATIKAVITGTLSLVRARPALTATCPISSTWALMPGAITACGFPRPDLSISTGSSNACTQCHQDQSDSWANDIVNDWGVKPDIKVLNQAKARVAADRGDLRALPSLEALVSDNQQPGIIRSAATEQITNLGSPRLSAWPRCSCAMMIQW